MPKKSQSSKGPKKTNKQPVEAAKALPGYWELVRGAFTLLDSNRAVFVRLAVLAWATLLLLTGLSHYAYYTGLVASTDEVAGQLPPGLFRSFVEVVALTASLISGGAATTFTETQQVFVGLVYLLLWLITVWLVRHIVSDTRVNLRDGLYAAAGPLVPTFLLVLFLLLQLLPFALLVSVIVTVATTGAVQGVLWTLLGAMLMLLGAAATLYWIIGAVLALVVVALPGTYPVAALRLASRVVSGYRGQLILRVLGLLLLVGVVTLVASLVLVSLDALTGYHLSVLVILVTQFISVGLFLYSSTYMYLLYREVIDGRS